MSKTVPKKMSLRTAPAALRMRLIWLLSASFSGSCTPIAPVGDQSPSDAGTTTKPQKLEAATGEVQNAHVREDLCEQEAARSCEGDDPSRQPLLCEDGVWLAQRRCTEDEHCDQADGATQGTCVKIASECIGRLPGSTFCDGTSIRVCSNGASSVVRKCEAEQHCVTKDGQSSCECAPGTIETQEGCAVPATCDTDNGGCDSLTQCSTDGTSRVCSACPDGFSGGDGSHGCTPKLLDLSAHPAALTPALSDLTYTYRAKLPLLRPTLTLTPRVPAGVDIRINGADLDETGSWTSEPFGLGEHTVLLTLAASNGLSQRYELIVERSGVQEAVIQQEHADDYDSFGFSVAVSGDTLVVGATAEDGANGGVDADDTNNAATEAGAAYVFVREGGKWVQQAYLKADAPQSSEFFGASVAIDGDTILVGATRAGDHLTDVTTLRYRQGAVYVFQREGTVWSQRGVLESGRSDVEWFGWTTALTKDTILVGAPHDSEDAEASGAVYVFSRTPPFAPLAKVPSPEPSRGGVFGWSLATDGKTLLVGSPENTLREQGPGMVFEYERVADNWEPREKLVASSRSDGASFGWSVALQGTLAAVGAPHPGAPHGQATGQRPPGDVYLYRRAPDGWAEVKQLQAAVPRDSDYFGIRVALSDRTLFVGACGDSTSDSGFDADLRRGNLRDAGAFYLFTERSQDWWMTNFVKSSNTIRDAQFGDSAALSGDTLVVGAMHDNGPASQSGRVYVFR